MNLIIDLLMVCKYTWYITQGIEIKSSQVNLYAVIVVCLIDWWVGWFVCLLIGLHISIDSLL